MKKNIFIYLKKLYLKNYYLILIMKGSSRGATLSFTLRSKGEVGYFRYLII